MIDNVYYDVPTHIKERVGLPINYLSLTRDQQDFIDTFYKACRCSSNLLEDLNSIKDELESAIEQLKD